jgi:hypothetical protein
VITNSWPRGREAEVIGLRPRPRPRSRPRPVLRGRGHAFFRPRGRGRGRDQHHCYVEPVVRLHMSVSGVAPLLNKPSAHFMALVVAYVSETINEGEHPPWLQKCILCFAFAVTIVVSAKATFQVNSLADIKPRGARQRNQYVNISARS